MSFTHCKHISFSLLFITAFNICLTATSQTTGDYRSNAASVTWESAASWQTWNGTSWVSATTAPSAATFSNNTISVLASHTLTFANNYTFAATNKLVVENTGIIDFAGGAGTTVNFSGTLIFKGTAATQVKPTNPSGGGQNTLTFNAGATIEIYNINGVAGTNCTFLAAYNKLNVNFNAGANFILSGGASQSSTGLPSTLNTLTINNANGVTLPAATTVSTALNLAAGILNNSTNNIILGNGATITRSGGSLSAAPSFGTTVNVVYAQHTGAITTGNELPTTTSVLNNLTINNSNGVNLNAACTVNGTITLTNGLFVLGNNNITSVKATSPISGGSATSYIKTSGTGTIKASVANTATVTFPVGNSSYNALTITNRTGTADAFAVRVYDAMNTNGSSSGTTVSTARVNRTWDITKTNTNSGSGIDLIFNWNSGDVVSTITNPELFHYTNAAGNWIKQTGTKTATSTSLTYTGYTGSFSPFAIADGLFTLPVSFLSFTAQKKDQVVVLNWTTASEQNADSYLIQHSANGSSWNTLGSVKAFGNSTTLSAYSFRHTSPLADKNFYRIYQVDVNGQGYYTPIVQVSNNQMAAGKILSNPVSNGLLTVQINSSTTIQLYSSDGQMLIEKQCAAGVNSINVSTYSKGMYQLRMGDKLMPFIIQ